jgi:hypothetical protein
MWHEKHYYYYVEHIDMNLTQLEPLKSAIKWLNDGD